MKKPIIGITMGDPVSVGPEITIKALADKSIYEKCRPIVIGDVQVMKNALGYAGNEAGLTINGVTSVKDALFRYGTIDVYDIGMAGLADLELGKISEKAGDAAFQSVKQVIELALAGEVDGTVTNALNKEALNLAGHHYSGHTEIYADLTKTAKYSMMLAFGDLRVVHVSTHVSLREACDRVKKARVLDVIHIAEKACKSLGIMKPRIAVAGLNPHSGENGLFGTEEIMEIIPAIEAAVSEGLDVTGPVPPDTIFSKAKGGWYDIVVAMYHDQGHIPLKLLGFDYDRVRQEWKAVEGVNITLGLPIIRASVDHGTAFDLAGTGKANELSLLNAIDYAVTMTNYN